MRTLVINPRHPAPLLTYDRSKWSESQREFHTSASLDDAMHKASCLAGGWYERPVTVWGTIVGLDEFYQMAPADYIPKDDETFRGYRRLYTVEAHNR